MGKKLGECWRNSKYSLIDYVINRLMHGVDAHCSFLNPKPESASAPSPSVFPSYSPKQETRVRADESLPITKRAKTRADVTGVLYLLSPCDHLRPRLPFSSSYIICSILSLLLFLILLILLLQLYYYIDYSYSLQTRSFLFTFQNGHSSETPPAGFPGQSLPSADPRHLRMD